MNTVVSLIGPSAKTKRQNKADKCYIGGQKFEIHVASRFKLLGSLS